MIRDIDNTKLPLFDHLIELRTRLVRCAIVLVVAFLPCFYFGQDIYNFLARPLYDISVKQACDEGESSVEWLDGLLYQHFRFRILDPPPEPAPGGEEDEARPGGPAAADCEEAKTELLTIIFTSPAEAFLTLVKVGFFASLCVSLPFLAWQLWSFVAPGLYRKEKFVVLPFMLVFPFLFTLGAAMVYFVFFPVALEFLLSFQQTPTEAGELPIEAQFKISEYFGFLLKLIFAFGISFQLPLVVTLLARTGMASSTGLRDKRKYAIVAVFVLAAVITPPDPFSQLGLALPLILLYEIAIVCARMVERSRARRMAEEGLDDVEETAAETEDVVDETDFNPTR